MKRIPKSFCIGPHEITVKVVSKAEMAAQDADEPLGLWDRDALTIRVQRVRKGFTKSAQMHCFWHEFMHAAFECFGYEKLSSNEQLVDQMGMALMQANQSFKF